MHKIVQMFSGKCRVVQRATQWRKLGHSSMHSFRAVSSAAQPRSWDSHIVPTSLTSGLMPWFTCAKKSCQLSMNKKRTLYTWFQSRWSKTQWAISTKMQCPQTSWRRPLWVFFAIPKKTVLNSLSGASFIFFLWIILFELCPHIRCQSRKIIL